ncbi:50S ribosomal protein L20 [Kiritimatiella glycovorans]|uniref:Large ribosomal subunit protein bL20 n=1 Tax=Kiritimatiella glycovorans TaxID=1307763 RepID=A0A0G3EE82_9BACT|nr:50S ribosomal protein L20 [Kiritimatiella glycovorans]AKJ64628.1 50S ribosomal protein L20 [Kiritimatiella glycovorans]
MPRSSNAPASRKRRKRKLKDARGFRGSRSKLYRQATENVDYALAFNYVGRKQKKRQFRRLWISRLSAACGNEGISYHRFMEGLRKAGIELNRKMLSEIAIHDQEGFRAIVGRANAALENS